MKTTIEVILNPCPWCKKTPELIMPIYEDTWLWKVGCRNPSCLIQCESPHVSIRKTSKKDIRKIGEKLDELARMWNTGNNLWPYERKIIDATKVLHETGIHYR